MAVKSQLDFHVDVKIGERLRLERKKVGLNQSDLAAIGGVSLGTQHRYEAGGLPATEYLMRIGEAGADWYWILTGSRLGDSLTQDETRLVDMFRLLGEDAQRGVLIVLANMGVRGNEVMTAGIATSGTVTADPIQGSLHEGQSGFKGER